MTVVCSAHAWRSNLSRGFLPLDRRCGLKEEEEGRSSAEALAHSDLQVFGDSDRKTEPARGIIRGKSWSERTRSAKESEARKNRCQPGVACLNIQCENAWGGCI